MKYVIFLILLLSSISNIYSWELFNAVTNSQRTIKKVSHHFTFKGIPPLKNKDMFTAVNDMSILQKKSVRKHLAIYLSLRRDVIKRAIVRSFRYLPTVVQIFKKKSNIPLEISLLPLLESGFCPVAVSRSRAVGLWQFMYYTALGVNLKINRYIDERRNIEKSTKAAIRHLNNLYKQFKNWELALAAYNGGGGYLRRTMGRHGIYDFWTLMKKGHLKRETAEYVPKFIAFLLIFNNKKLFDIDDECKKPEIFKIKSYNIKKPVYLWHLAKMAGISIRKLKFYNPELIGYVTPVYLKSYMIFLPEKNIKILKKNKSKLHTVRVRALRKYIVRKGDTIWGISRRYRISGIRLIRYNNIKSPSLIQPGRVIFIPY